MKKIIRIVGKGIAYILGSPLILICVISAGIIVLIFWVAKETGFDDGKHPD